MNRRLKENLNKTQMVCPQKINVWMILKRCQWIRMNLELVTWLSWDCHGRYVTFIKCVPKKVDWAKYLNRHGSKSVWVIKLSFCQNDSPMRGSFWQKDSFITHILFELCLFSNLAQSTFFRYTLYVYYLIAQFLKIRMLFYKVFQHYLK